MRKFRKTHPATVRGFIKTIVIIFLLLFLLPLGTSIGYQSYTQTDPGQRGDLTGGYLRYHNPDFNFSFLYPDDLTYKEWDPVRDILSSVSFKPQSRPDREVHSHESEISVSVFANGEGLDFDSWVDLHSIDTNGFIHEDVSGSGALFINAGQSVSLEIASKEALILHHSILEIPAYRVLVPVEDNILSISLVGQDPEQLSAGFVTMLASLSFSTPMNQPDQNIFEYINTTLDRILTRSPQIGFSPDYQFALIGYKLPWANGLSHTVLQGWFGSYSHSNGSQMEYAYDFNTSEGEKLLASKGGTVSAATGGYTACGGSEYANLGNRVVINHNDGYATLYLHLQQVDGSISVGQSISQGTTLGTSGKTGWTNCSPHLHFQRQYQGIWFTQSVPVYFDEYENLQLSTGNAYTSQNGTGGSACSAYSYNGIVLFEHAQCTGNTRQYNSPQYISDLNDVGFNDITSSIHVAPGWSVRVWEHSDRGGATRCVTQSMWDLSVDLYDSSSISMNDTISSVEVFSNSSCSTSSATPTSTLPSPPTSRPTPTSIPPTATPHNWLLEFSKFEKSLLEVEIHTVVDAPVGVYDAHRVTIDGIPLFETSAAEYYHTWNTFGWADGFHTMRVQYRRLSDNGNWGTALFHEEQYYLSPNRNGTSPCNGMDGAELVSGSDCIILLQSFPSLDTIGWSDRSDLYVTVRGNYEAWVYDGGNYQGAPKVVTSGQTLAVGGNVSSIDLRPPPSEPPPLPTTPFPVDQDTSYLFNFDEGTGSISQDLVVGLVGNLGSSVGWSTGQFGNALSVTEVSGPAFITPAIDVCPLTVEMWVKANNPGGRIASQLGGGGNTGQNKWVLSLDNYKPKLEIWEGAGNVVSFKQLTQGNWHLIMFSYDCAQTAKLYVDNVLVGELNVPQWNSGSTTFEVGSGEGIFRCACEVDEIRLSNVVRTPAVFIPPPTLTPSPTATATLTPTNTSSPTMTHSPTSTLGPALNASAVCNGPDLKVTIASGDGPFNITASAGMNLPVNSVGLGTTTISGPEKWDNVTVWEMTGDLESVNLGQFKCRTDERPVLLSPLHRQHTSDSTPTFGWLGISGASVYRLMLFDDKVVANRAVDIRQNTSGAETNLTLSQPLSIGRYFWRIRGRQNRVWSLWSTRFTLFIDSPTFTITMPVPTVEPEPPAQSSSPTPIPVPGPVTPPTFPAPPNSR